jgi:hypothetical protein
VVQATPVFSSEYVFLPLLETDIEPSYAQPATQYDPARPELFESFMPATQVLTSQTPVLVL